MYKALVLHQHFYPYFFHIETNNQKKKIMKEKQNTENPLKHSLPKVKTIKMPPSQYLINILLALNNKKKKTKPFALNLSSVIFSL